jgi:type IV pilus assembly protein PilO
MKMELTAIAIPKRYSLPLIIGLNIVILVASYFLVFGAQFQEKAALDRELGTARQELARLTAIRNNLDKVRREYAALTEDLEGMTKQMPEEKEIPNLFRQVSSTAQGARMKIKYFAPKEAQPADFYSELPFEIKYTGLYHSLGYFFDGVKNLERIVHVTSFSMESKGTVHKPILEGSCLAKTYVYQKDGASIKKDGTQDKSKDQKKDMKNGPNNKPISK